MFVNNKGYVVIKGCPAVLFVQDVELKNKGFEIRATTVEPGSYSVRRGQKFTVFDSAGGVVVTGVIPEDEFTRNGHLGFVLPVIIHFDNVDG